MTRPDKISKRKAFNKALRARAAEEHTSFAEVLQRTQDAQSKRSYRAMLNQPTHLDRSQRQSMINAPHQRHEPLNPDNERDECPCCEACAEALGFVETEPRAPIAVNLMALAEPAKVKGVAKDYEVVKRVKDVIALDDTISEFDLDEEGWEQLACDDFKERRTYSAALSGK